MRSRMRIVKSPAWPRVYPYPYIFCSMLSGGLRASVSLYDHRSSLTFDRQCACAFSVSRTEVRLTQQGRQQRSDASDPAAANAHRTLCVRELAIITLCSRLYSVYVCMRTSRHHHRPARASSSTQPESEQRHAFARQRRRRYEMMTCT